MQIWFILVIIAIISVALAELIQQHILTSQNPLTERVTMGVESLLHGCMALLFAFFIGELATFPKLFEPEILPYFVFVCFSSFVAIFLYLKSFNVKNISISIIFFSSSVFVTVPLGILFYGESLSIIKFLGIALILTAVIILNYAKKTIERNNYFAILAGILFGLNYVLDKKIVLATHPSIYLGLNLIAVSLLSIFANFRTFKKDVKKINLKLFWLLFISAFLYFFYNIAIFYGYTFGGEVGKMDAMNGSYVFIIIVIEYFLFKQKGDIARKIIASIIGIAGIFILGYFN